MGRRLSHRLSWLLRHGANEVGLPMDAAGWVAVADLRAHVDAPWSEVLGVIERDAKRRYQLVGDRIRACQGHSTAGTPVTAAALEASWERVDRREPLFHGTTRDNVRLIEASGILRPMARTHVHLADAPDARVGKRAAVEVLLVVDPGRLDGPVFRSPNGVFLVREVPWGCIVGERPG